MHLPRELYDQMVDHARAEAPNECCGIVGTADGQAATFYPARNLHESPMRFEIHPEDMYAIYQRTEAAGEEIGILFHSHPRTEAYPSQTDVNINARIAEVWGDVVWLIASLAGDEPVVRGFQIAGGSVEELDLVVD
jgi:proteasome lid subunit RPN8/RPN11